MIKELKWTTEGYNSPGGQHAENPLLSVPMSTDPALARMRGGQFKEELASAFCLPLSLPPPTLLAYRQGEPMLPPDHTHSTNPSTGGRFLIHAQTSRRRSAMPAWGWDFIRSAAAM